MSRLRSLAVVVLLLSCTGARSQETVYVQKASRTGPKKSSDGKTYLNVRVTTNSKGRVVSAVIIKSSGSAILDRHCTKYAKENWSGPPNTTKDVPCYYKLANP